MIIEKVDAFMVNLSNGVGKQLMWEKDVELLIENELGVVIDKLGFSLTPKQKLEFHKKLMEQLPHLARVNHLVQLFEEAKRPGPFDR